MATSVRRDLMPELADVSIPSSSTCQPRENCSNLYDHKSASSGFSQLQNELTDTTEDLLETLINRDSLDRHRDLNYNNAKGFWNRKISADWTPPKSNLGHLAYKSLESLTSLSPSSDTSDPGSPATRYGLDSSLYSNGAMLSAVGCEKRADNNRPPSDDDDDLGDRKLTMEVVSVPSSQHVAEIVGKSGGMIRELRERTNTYVRTPLLGESPEFIISGSVEDVARAKEEILKLSRHFTELRTQQEDSNKVTKKFRVPYASVGLVVGFGGTHIKKIRSSTKTLIITPKPLQDPVFTIKGTPANVDKAIDEICIRLRKNKVSPKSRVLDGYLEKTTPVMNPKSKNNDGQSQRRQCVIRSSSITSTSSSVRNTEDRENDVSFAALNCVQCGKTMEVGATLLPCKHVLGLLCRSCACNALPPGYACPQCKTPAVAVA